MGNDEFLKDFYAIVERALHISEIARREGLLAVEDSLDNDKVENRDIFEYGLRFVVDGTDDEVIDKILSNIIKQEKDELQLKLKTIQKEAVLAIHEGVNTRILFSLLNSYTDIPLNDPVFKKILGD